MPEEYPDSDLSLSPRDPMTQEQYDRVIQLLSQGWTAPSIAEETGVSKRKIKAIKHRNPGLESAYKEHVINNLTEFASRGLERMNRDLPLMHIDKLPLAVAIVIDKAQLLQGQATHRIETHKGLSQEQIIQMLEEMKERNAKAKEIETETSVIEPSRDSMPSSSTEPALNKPSQEIRRPYPGTLTYGQTKADLD